MASSGHALPLQSDSGARHSIGRDDPSPAAGTPIGAAAEEKVDGGDVIVFKNGKIWTWDHTGTSPEVLCRPQYHFSDWMVVRGDVVEVSTRLWACSQWAPTSSHPVAHGIAQSLGVGEPPCVDACTVQDLGGRIVLPGLQDSHIHILETGNALASCNVLNANSIGELQSRLQEYVTAQPGAQWIIGGGWEQDKLGRYPTAADLDEVASDRPILLSRVCTHIAVLNSKAMELIGFNARCGAVRFRSRCLLHGCNISMLLSSFAVQAPGTSPTAVVLRLFRPVDCISMSVSHTQHA